MSNTNPGTEHPTSSKAAAGKPETRNRKPEHLHIPYAELKSTLEKILLANGLPPEAANTCAEVFATNSLEGVYSHGVNRFPRFLQSVRSGHVKADQRAVCKHQAGALEQWDGQSGPGPVNAFLAVDRAMKLASAYGMGCVSLAHTNHWLRGGTYAWRAAKAGFAYIAWSNTMSNMPPWGAVEKKLGNNPIILAVPARRGELEPHEDEAIVLDMALSQYSFGALEISMQNNEQLPLPGGYDKAGNLTTDPAAIRESLRPLPIGYWKGAGLSLLLDILATVLSGGLSTSEISKERIESKLSQVFICIDLSKLHNYTTIGTTLKAILDDYRAATPVKPGDSIRYPGERVVAIRKENLEKGVPVLKSTWEKVVG